MSERYARLFSLPENLYASGSPVVIAAGALLKDNQTGKVLAQLKLRSISPKMIIGVKVKLSLFDNAGNSIGAPAFFDYLDLSVSRDMEFGQKTPVPVAESKARAYTVEVRGVVYADKTTWVAKDAPWEPLPRHRTLGAVLRDAQLVKQYQIAVGSCVSDYPMEEKDLWYCVCGAWNHAGESCHVCRRTLDELQGISLEQLTADRDARLAKEAADKAVEEAAAKEAKKKAAKTMKIVISSVCAVLVLGILLHSVIIPGMKYRKAVSLMEQGSFSEAIAAFEAIGDYKDSAAQIKKCEAAMEEAHNATSDGRGFTPGYSSDSALTNNSVDIRSVTLAELDDGDMQYTMEFRATRGMNVGFLSMSDESYYPDFIMMRDQKTSGSWETVSFEVEDAKFRKADLFGMVIWDGVQGKIEEGEKGYQLLMEIMEESKEIYVLTLWKTEAMALQTSGNPVGESKRVSCSTEGNVTVHSLTAQLLDNGYVRYTLDYTTPQGCYISFFNPPSGSVFMYVSEKPTSDERGTYVVDVKKEANNSVDSITIKFFSQDYGDYVSFAPIRF